MTMKMKMYLENVGGKREDDPSLAMRKVMKKGTGDVREIVNQIMAITTWIRTIWTC
jgi:hypothetical protein